MIRAKETDLVREVRELQINLEKTKCDYEESKVCARYSIINIGLSLKFVILIA